MRNGDLPQRRRAGEAERLPEAARRLPEHCRGVVAIPACNEEARIAACLAALAVQRDGMGAPLPEGTFGVLVFANNCQDGTVAEVERQRDVYPFPLGIVSAALPPAEANAGRARKAAMDAAASVLEENRRGDGILFTTDADSAVCSTWISSTLAEIEAGADAVAGYIEAQPAELVALGRVFNGRGRLEDTYLARMAEMLALCDPQAHDPWPNHRVASGASLALTLQAYRAIGGLPPRPLGEDVALVEALLDNGFRLRHALHITVTTSSRLDGRAAGGAADTMRLRRDEPDTVCDGDMEPALILLRRWAWKGRLRIWDDTRHMFPQHWAMRLGLTRAALDHFADRSRSFEARWRALEAASPLLCREPPLRPSQLAGETLLAGRIIKLLQRRARAMSHRAPGQHIAFSTERPSLARAGARR